MKKNKIDVTYDIYFYNIYSEIMKELAEIESNIFQNLTDTQIEYLEKIKFYFFKIFYIFNHFNTKKKK